ncbi:MAG: hypothetical protein H6Q93_275 [Nitrospirae bacterium]|nr:hypothetical protein [Nitrospirota bacterium]
MPYNRLKTFFRVKWTPKNIDFGRKTAKSDRLLTRIIHKFSTTRSGIRRDRAFDLILAALRGFCLLISEIHTVGISAKNPFECSISPVLIIVYE